MAGMKLEAFQGLIPRSSDRLLPPMAATAARNTKLLNGEVRGFRAIREEADFTAGAVDPVRRAFRVVDNAGVNADTWLTFDSRDVDIVRSPIVNDGFDRYYWAGDGRPMMNTYDRIFAGSSAFYLGIPTPTNAPGVTPPAGSDETRAYVYTFVSAYGEEGPPSPPTLGTGDAGTWVIDNFDTTVPDSSSRNITSIRIYRTVTGGSSSNFYLVDTIALGTSSYNDTEVTSDVASNSLLESTAFLEPPTDMEGFVVMPNGYLVGWKGRRLLFSEPYRPHAWPAAYELSTEFPIVGLVVWGSTLVIGTKSQPYFGQGTTPNSFTMQKLDAVEPCLSRRGMVATTAGAYYPSINGLILANSSGAKVITQDILTKEEWASYNPSSIYAAQLGLQYIAFNSQTFGFIFNPTEPQTKLVELDSFADVDGIETDKYSGNVLLLANNYAMEWDPSNSERLNWRWQSKKYQFPEPINFGAVRLNFKTGSEDISADVSAYYGAYNASLFAAVPSGTAPQDGDPFWSSVQLLANFNGVDAATAYTDLSDNAAVATFNGNAQLDTGEKVFGTASLLLDGTGDDITFPDIAAYDLDANDWTIEGFVRLNAALPSETSLGPGFVLFSMPNAGGSLLTYALVDDGVGHRVRIEGNDFAELGTIAGGISTATWYHWAVTRESGTIRAYFNGNYETSDFGASDADIGGPNAAIRIGSLDGASGFHNGWIDGVRMEIGRAKYTGTSAYTVPATEFEEGAAVPAEQKRGLNTVNGHSLGGSPAQARGLVSGWAEPETRQPLGGSLIYPESFLSFQTLAVRLQVKVGRTGEVKFDKVIYNEEIVRLPTGFKNDLWQFNFFGNTDLYSAQVATTPRALKGV